MNRQEYLAEGGFRSHREYYGQFVSQATINWVVRCIGDAKIMASTNRYFNDIPLHLWDNAAWSGDLKKGNLKRVIPVGAKIADFGDVWTAAGMVCVAKEAARQYKEAQEANMLG